MLICAECLMRRRLASLQATGQEPPFEVRADDGLPPVFQAVTVINAVALCAGHFVECVQPQHQSGLLGANGAPIILAGAGAPR